MFVLHIFTLVGFLIINQFYHQVLKNFINPVITRSAQIGISALVIANAIFLQDLKSYNSYSLTLVSVVILVYAIFTFLVFQNPELKEKEIPNINSIQYLNSGLFIYFLSSLLIFHFGNLITQFAPSNYTHYTWAIHALFTYVMYVYFFLGLWNQSPVSSSSRS